MTRTIDVISVSLGGAAVQASTHEESIPLFIVGILATVCGTYGIFKEERT